MAEPLRVSLWWHAADRTSVLVARLGVVLKLLSKRVASEDVNHAHEVDVLLV